MNNPHILLCRRRYGNNSGLMRRCFLVSLVAFFCFLSPLAGEDMPQNRGDYLTVKIAVIGPGDELYFWWGHLGLVIDDRLTGDAWFYDYGVFTFNSDNFVSNFAFGRLWYTTMVSPASTVIKRYISDNRSVTLYELDLSAAQKLELYRLTENNLLPEYCDYLYNHFNDNCVTRILNNLDTVLDGSFYREADMTPGRLTLRGHVRRHTAQHPVWDWILNFLMGQVIDKPITARNEMFLPSETGRFIQHFMITDTSGISRPLVKNIEELWTAPGRPPILDEPWNNLPGAFSVGFILAAFGLWLRSYALKNAVLARRIYGAYNALLGCFGGLAGSTLFFMTFFTNHDYTFENSNVLFANPLLLAAIPAGILVAVCANERIVRRCALVLRILWSYVFLAALVALALKLSPAFYQNNSFVLAVFLPLSLVLCLGLGNKNIFKETEASPGIPT